MQGNGHTVCSLYFLLEVFMQDIEHIVDFYKYCESCRHYDKQDFEDPCNECLTNTINLYSRKPVNYEQKTGKSE